MLLGTQTVNSVISVGFFLWPASPLTDTDRIASFIVLSATDYGAAPQLDFFGTTGNIAGIAVDDRFIYVTTPVSGRTYLVVLTNAADPTNVASFSLAAFRDASSGGNFSPLSVRFTSDGTPNQLLISTFGQGRAIFLTLSADRTSITTSAVRNLTGLPTVGSQYDLLNDAASTIYTAINNQFVYTFNPTGSPKTRFTGFPTTLTTGYTANSQLYGLTIQPSTGTLYVTDYPNRQIYRLSGLVAPRSAAVGDPQFHGFRQQSFQVHGVDGQCYSIISDSLVQINARFDFLARGRCPQYSGVSSTVKPTNCWSHSGSYFGLMTVQTANGDRFLIGSGPAQQGFAQVEMNGRSLINSDHGITIDGVAGNDRASLTFIDPHHLVINAGVFTLHIDNSDMFLNIDQVSVSDWPRLVNDLQSHGILGQTWKLLSGSERGAHIGDIEGVVDDYADAGNDIWGNSNSYNKFERVSL